MHKQASLYVVPLGAARRTINIQLNNQHEPLTTTAPLNTSIQQRIQKIVTPTSKFQMFCTFIGAGSRGPKGAQASPGYFSVQPEPLEPP